MKKFYKKIKVVFLTSIIVSLAVLGLLMIQSNIINISAMVDPLIIEIAELDFGSVFSGEILQKTFNVKLSPDYNEVGYEISLHPKPRNEEDRQYCKDNPDDYDRCYPDLCLFLEKESLDIPDEADLPELSHLSFDDNLDLWSVDLTVPAIKGFTDQSYQDLIINEADVRGCDININSIYEEKKEPTCTGNCGTYVVIVPVPKLSITKIIEVEFANPEQVVEYQIIVENKGDFTAFNTVLTDKLEKGLTHQETNGRRKTWDLGDLKSGEKREIIYPVVVNEDADEGIYSNVATVKADNHKKIQDEEELEVKKIKVAGEELVPTGFKTREFIFLVLIFLFLGGNILFLKRRLVYEAK